MHLRPLPEEHRETYREFLNYAFRPENGPDWSDERLPDPESYRPRGFYDAPPDAPVEDLDAADLRTVCAFYDFTARVRGEWHPLPGISAVASPPEARRQGHVAAMLDALLAEFRDTGRYLSALWPFEYAFYRRFGWATASNYAKTTVPPDELGAVAADRPGSSSDSTPTTGGGSKTYPRPRRPKTSRWTEARAGFATGCSAGGTTTRSSTAGSETATSAATSSTT